MNFCKPVVAMLMLLLSVQVSAATVSLTPTSNVSVMVYDNDWNPYWVQQGGVDVGLTNWSVARVYEQFVLPAYVPGTSITAADFNSFYAGNKWDDPANPTLFATSNNWDSSNISWPTKPAPQGALGAVNLVAGQSFHIDVTAYVNDAYKNGGVVSFIIMDGMEGWRYSSRTLSVDKHLDLTISAVPEPATFALLIPGLALIGLRARRKAKQAEQA